MSNYDAVYSATLSAIRSTAHNGNIGEAVRQAFDISWAVEQVKSDINSVVSGYSDAATMELFKASGGELLRDGNCWCAISQPERGPNACEGYSEDSRMSAVREWTKNFNREEPRVPLNELKEKE